MKFISEHGYILRITSATSVVEFFVKNRDTVMTFESNLLILLYAYEILYVYMARAILQEYFSLENNMSREQFV